MEMEAALQKAALIRNEDLTTALASEQRIGGPNLCRLPMCTRLVRGDHPLVKVWDKDLKGAVEEILFPNKLSETGPLLQDVVWVWDLPNTTQCTRDITLWVPADSTQKRNEWWSIYTKIRAACVKYGYPDLNIEISTTEGRISIRSFPVKYKHPIFKHWDSLQPKIKSILKSADWVALELLRRGKFASEEDFPVTVVVTVAEESPKKDWDRERDQIAFELERLGLGEVAVEVGRGSVCLLGRNVLDRPKYGVEATFRGSLGVSGVKTGAGTLGGVLELVFAGGITRLYMTTCHHCVLPPQYEHPNKDDWERYGLPCNVLNDIEVDQPSFSDLRETKEWLESKIKEIKQRADYERVQDILDKDDSAFIIPPHQKAYERLQETIAIYQSKIDDLNPFEDPSSRRLGKVFMSSGKQRVKFMDGHVGACDWALLEVEQGRQTQNYLRPREDFKSTIDIYAEYNPDGTVITSTASLPDGNAVFKQGRSTGFSMGFLAGRRTCEVRSWFRKDDGNLIEENGKDNAVVGHVTEGEWEAPGREHRFSIPGDSGSWVFDGHGALVGMAFAANNKTNVSYIMAVAELFEDIKKKTGALEVRLPRLGK